LAITAFSSVLHREFVGLGAVDWCDFFQLMPSVHRVAELEMAGGGIEVELVGGVEGHYS
jgi:hypothetical protein